MIKGLIIGLGAFAAAALFIADQIGGALAQLAEDTQEYPSCDNCIGQVDMTICQYCNDGSCWEHINDHIKTNTKIRTRY